MTRMILSIACAAALLSGAAYAHEHDMKSPTTGPTTKASGPTTKPVNDMCIVETKNPVDDRELIFYNGQWIGFCCADCKADFKKNPEKYIGNLP